MFRIAILLCAALAFQGCGTLLGSKDSDDDQQLQGAAILALLTQNQCSFNGVSFTAGSGVTCAGGAASGTGTLIPSTTSSGDLSLQITFSVASGGSVEIQNNVASVNSGLTAGFSLLAGTGTRRARDGAGNTKTFAAAFTISPDVSQQYCVDFHTEGSEQHVVMVKGACPSTVTNMDNTVSCSASIFNSEATTCTGSAGTLSNNNKPGSAWGFILTNVVITEIRRNSSNRYSG